MDKTLETMLVIISAVFVLYTAMIDPRASLIVALVAVVCLVVYRKMFGGVKVEKAKTVRKIKAVKKTVRAKRK